MRTRAPICASVVLAAAGLIAAQQPSSTPEATGDRKSKTVTVRVQSGSALAHLKEAKTTLGAVTGSNLGPHAASRLAELRTRFDALERSYSAGGRKTITQQEGPYGNTVKISQSPDWSPRIADIDRLAGELLGFPTASGQRIQVDAATRGRLEEFRKHLTAFAKAASGSIGAPPGK
jgi:hypothetical protein